MSRQWLVLFPLPRLFFFLGAGIDLAWVDRSVLGSWTPGTTKGEGGVAQVCFCRRLKISFLKNKI